MYTSTYSNSQTLINIIMQPPHALIHTLSCSRHIHSPRYIYLSLLTALHLFATTPHTIHICHHSSHYIYMFVTTHRTKHICHHSPHYIYIHVCNHSPHQTYLSLLTTLKPFVTTHHTIHICHHSSHYTSLSLLLTLYIYMFVTTHHTKHLCHYLLRRLHEAAAAA